MSTLSRRTFLASTAGLLATSSCYSAGEPKIKTATTRFDVERFVDDVKRARAEDDSEEAVEAVVARAVSSPNDVLRALGEPKQAGINTLYADDEVSIFNLVWGPLMVLVPHNHLMWASIGIYTGRENNIMWKRTGHTIKAATAASLSEKEVLTLPVDAIHSVTNPLDRLTGAIHVYGGNLTTVPRSQWDAETLHEKPFDFEEGRRLFREANERF